MALRMLAGRVCYCATVAVFAQLTVACASGGDGGGSTEPEPVLVSLSLSTTTLAVGLGQSRTVTVNIARQGDGKGDVTLGLGLAVLPTGVTATFDPSVVTRTTTSSTLTIAVAPDAPTGQMDLFVTVTGGDHVGQPPMFTLRWFAPQVSVTRAGPGSGTVTSNPAGINCGGTCTANFKATPLTLTATPAAGSTFAGWSGACVATTTTCTFTPTVPASGPNSTNVTATFTAPSFSLSVAPASISVAQGASATATVTITRTSGFTGAVNLAFAGVATGLTITPNPATITGGTATLTIATALSVGVGNYPITINATAAGVAQQSATLPVQVTPSQGGSGNITLSFASCDPAQVPIWFAVQNGAGAWTRVTQGTNSTFTFAITSEGGVAYVTRSGNSYSTAVAFLSEGEASSIATGNICRSPQEGTRSLTTNVLNGGTQTVTVTLGGATTTFNPPPNQPSSGVPFTLTNFPAGQRDLIAARSVLQTTGTTQVQRLVLRRNTAYAQAATPPSINFTGPESFAPVAGPVASVITLSNLAGDQSSISESFMTTNGTSAPFFESIGRFYPAAGSDGVPWAAVPDSLLLPGDFHTFFIDAAPPGGNVNAGRFAALLLHAPPAAAPASVTLGPPLATPSVTSLGTTPNVRMRAQLPSQTAYNVAAGADFSQDSIIVEVLVTAAYSRGMPATWTIEIPDLTSAGYDAAWGLKTGMPVNWEVSALGGSVLPFLGATPVDGALMVGAGVSGSPSTVMQFAPHRRASGAGWLMHRAKSGRPDSNRRRPAS